MSTHEFYGPVSTDADLEGLRRILLQAFAIPDGNWETYFKRVGRENFRILRSGDQVIAALAVLSMGQWFGGRSVPMTGIAAVGVAPHSRGTGVAARLMEKVVLELHKDGVPISTLYPATFSLYRKSGYEVAGSMCLQVVRASSIQLRSREYPIHPATVSESDHFQRIATERAKISTANLDRVPRMWDHLTYSKDSPTYGYLIGPEAQPDGYLLFTQEHKEWGYDLRVRDMAALSAVAGRRLWSFLALHSSQCRDIYWKGPLVDPLVRLLPEPEHRIVLKESWMLRIVDVPKALETRGYPENLQSEVHLDIGDDLLGSNAGRFILRVADGNAEVTKGGRGDLRIDVRDLASLYTGMVSPYQLQSVGAIEATKEALTGAAGLFAAPQPWMADTF